MRRYHKKHQKVWIENYGDIPFDEKGRVYEIHHINGNHFDNRIENLMCVSIEDHYRIHLDQGDMRAAAAIYQRMYRRPDFNLNRAAGLESYASGKGVHGLSLEQRRANAALGHAKQKGFVWFTNGEKDTKALTAPGPEWKRGRSSSYGGVPVGHKLGVFWNDGYKNVRSVTCPGDNWTRGRLLSSEAKIRRQEIASSRKQSRSEIEDRRMKNLQKWKFIDRGGNIYEVDDLPKFCREKGLSYRMMCRLKYFKDSLHKGFSFYVKPSD